MIAFARCLAVTMQCCALMLAVSNVVAASFPERPVRLIVGFAPGGSTDASARVVAQALSDKWRQPVIVENRAGADGSIAADYVAHAAPDGYTILWASNSLTITASQRKQDYDPVKSFAPITLMGYVPELLLVNPATQINSVQELIALAKAKPKQLSFGSSGTGASSFLEMALLMNLTGIDMVNVTYKGGGPAMIALLSGETQLMFGTITTAVAQVKAGKLKALAISGKVRSQLVADVPTMVEAANLKGFEETSPWNGAMAPAGTPDSLVSRLHDDFVAAIKSVNVQKTIAEQGYVTIANSPQEFGEAIANDIARWTALLKKFDAK